MLRSASATDGIGAGGGPFSAEIQAAIRDELDAMLTTPIFVQSQRCKRFLRYIVEQSLAGNAGQLKERTIGIAVFERANDYDTGDDSIVRVTANEIRKRLSQFYAESSVAHRILIELPRGSYVPEFRIQPLRGSGKSNRTSPSDTGVQPGSTTRANAGEPQSVAPADIADRRHTAETSTGNVRRKRAAYAAIAVLLIAAAAAFAIWKVKTAKRSPDLWDSFTHAGVPILVCIDTHNLQPLVPEQSAEGQRFVDLVLRRQIISLDDAAILSSMASELGKRGIPFRVVGAEQTSLADLRRQPVILIGAIDNKWTVHLTQNLRYRIQIANPPGSGSGKEPIASIVDSEHPESTQWVTDLSVPFTAWKRDYAIVARIDDSTTGVPVLIEAGLGNDGTVAASELINTGALAETLANETSCHAKRNFEAVIGTQIIDTKSGPPHVLRLTCW